MNHDYASNYQLFYVNQATQILIGVCHLKLVYLTKNWLWATTTVTTNEPWTLSKNECPIKLATHYAQKRTLRQRTQRFHKPPQHESGNYAWQFHWTCRIRGKLLCPLRCPICCSANNHIFTWNETHKPCRYIHTRQYGRWTGVVKHSDMLLSPTVVDEQSLREYYDEHKASCRTWKYGVFFFLLFHFKSAVIPICVLCSGASRIIADTSSSHTMNICWARNNTSQEAGSSRKIFLCFACNWFILWRALHV